jgi:hypothetical protein
VHEIVNRTRFAVALLPYTTPAGVDHASIVIKGTFRITAAGLEPSEQPLPIALADARHGEAKDGSLRYAADLGWPKTSTDVALVGHAQPARASHHVDVELRIGALHKRVRVFGDRHWYRSVASWAISDPARFERMPLVYERAFGGYDQSDADASSHAWEPRNPVGAGFAARDASQRLTGLALPNLEDPRALITAWNDRPAPAGFGLIDAHWSPRAQLTGTYDKTWEEQRAPLLPEDFDPRFFNAAAPGLVAPTYLQGGEEVAISNVSARGPLHFRLPRQRLQVAAEIKGTRVDAQPNLDTVWIDSDAGQVVLVWRATFACPRSFLGIRVVFVKERAHAD